MNYIKEMLSEIPGASILRFGFISLILTVCYMCIFVTTTRVPTDTDILLIGTVLGAALTGKITQKVIEQKKKKSEVKDGTETM